MNSPSISFTILIFLAIISVLYPLNRKISESIDKKRNFLSEESLRGVSKLKYHPLYFSAYKALSSVDINVLIAVLVISQVLGKFWAIVLLGISSVFSTFWDTALTSLALSSDVRGCYRVLRFNRSGAAMASAYVFISYLWLLAMFLFLSMLVTDLDVLLRIFFLVFFVVILDWAAITFNYGYGILGAIVALAAVYYVMFPLNFISCFKFSPGYALLILMIGLPLILYYHSSLLEKKAGIEGKWEKYSTMTMIPPVVMFTLLGILWKRGMLPSLATDPTSTFSSLLVFFSILILFLPFPRASFAIHHSLKVQTKIEGSKIARWSTGTSLVYFSIVALFALIFSSQRGAVSGDLGNYLPLVLIALSLLSIGSTFSFSFEGLEFLAQRVPNGKGSPEVAKTMYLSYYVAVPILLATVAFYRFLHGFCFIYMAVVPTIAIFLLFATSVKRKKVEG